MLDHGCICCLADVINIETQNLLLSIQDGVSPLHSASQNGHIDVVELLVKRGAKVQLATTEVHILQAT